LLILRDTVRGGTSEVRARSEVARAAVPRAKTFALVARLAAELYRPAGEPAGAVRAGRWVAYTLPAGGPGLLTAGQAGHAVEQAGSQKKPQRCGFLATGV
jgi:hypothetical protein